MLRLVVDHEARRGLDAEPAGREAEHLGIGLGQADVGRDDDVVEEVGDAALTQALGPPAAGVREQAELDAPRGAQALDQRAHLGVDGGQRAEVPVERGQRGLRARFAAGRGDEGATDGGPELVRVDGAPPRSTPP